MIFFFVCLGFLFLAWRVARKGIGPEEYFVNGRCGSACATALSVMASCVGGSATLGMAGLAWQAGTPAFWWLGSGAAGLLVLSLFLARKVRESGAMTMPGMLDTCLGAPCRPLASIIIVVAWMAILAAQFSALAAIISPLTGLGHTASLFVGAVALVAYTLIGGQAAVMRSDIWQFAVLFLALAVALAFAVGAGGGGALAQVRLEVVNADFPASRLAYYLCILGGSYVVCPMLFGRFLSSRDADTAVRGGLWAVLGLVCTAVVIVALGIACRGLVPADTPPEQVLSTAFLTHLPSWASTLLLLGIFCAVISSADSCLITAASVCSNDILRRPSVAVCRWCMVVFGGAALLLSLSGKGILSLLLLANDIYVCGVVVPVFVGMLFFGRAHFAPWGMAAVMAAGGTTGFFAGLTENPPLSFVGLGFSLLGSMLAAGPVRHRIFSFLSFPQR